VAVDRELASAERHDGGLGGVRKEKKRGRREYLIMALGQKKRCRILVAMITWVR
jgi:hypothetical protein